MHASHFLRAAFATSFFFVALVFAAPARAEAPPADLMARLAEYAARFEKQRTHASYAVDGRMDMLDGDGKVDSTKTLTAEVAADGKIARFNVIKYVEDGEDKTDDAKKQAKERAEKKKKNKNKKEIKMPIRADQQARYVFVQAEVDAKTPSRVRIDFAPKQRAEDTVEGSAWVDATTGTILTASFRPSETPMFVDSVEFTVEFGRETSLGPAVSKVSVEGKGGILFFRKHFRATATLSDYRITP